MSYLVLARRFRPQTFDEIIGQEHVTRTLKNAIEADRVAHAFLFSGARGVGKTTAARVLAKALNCVEGPTTTPCGACDQCVGIAQSRAVDVQEIDGASNNSVDDVRALRETVPYQPSSGRFKVYIVDEVHMLTQSAFNALLKTLEEPPPHVKFVFATTEPHKIPVTILSRCQRYDFRLVPTQTILKRLESILEIEEVEWEPSALSLLAREAQGSMRDALSLLDQALAFSAERLETQQVARLLGVADRSLLIQVSAALLTHDAASALRAVESAVTFGCDLTRFSHDLLHHLRNLVVLSQCPGERDLVEVTEEEHAELKEQVEGHAPAELHRLFLLFSKATEEIARSSQPRLLLEMTLARLASLEPMRSLEELAQRLERLSAGRPPPTGAPPQQGNRGAPQGSRTQLLDPPRRFQDGGGNRSAPPRGEVKARPPDPPARLEPSRRPTADSRARAPRSESSSRGAATPRGGEERGSEEDEPSSSPGSAPTDSTSLEAAWRELLQRIQRTSQPLYHLFRYAEPAELSPRKVKLRLPDQPLFRGAVSDPHRIKGLQKICRDFFQADVQVELEVNEDISNDAMERANIDHAARMHERRREAMEHIMVRAALSEFEGAQIKEIRLHEDKDK